MNQFLVEMPLVNECVVANCAYNVDHGCHAKAITIGDMTHPGCDTFLKNESHTHHLEVIAGVGACKTLICQHNDDFECTMDQIHVGMRNGGPNCVTFVGRG